MLRPKQTKKPQHHCISIVKHKYWSRWEDARQAWHIQMFSKGVSGTSCTGPSQWNFQLPPPAQLQQHSPDWGTLSFSAAVRRSMPAVAITQQPDGAHRRQSSRSSQGYSRVRGSLPTCVLWIWKRDSNTSPGVLLASNSKSPFYPLLLKKNLGFKKIIALCFYISHNISTFWKLML